MGDKKQISMAELMTAAEHQHVTITYDTQTEMLYTDTLMQRGHIAQGMAWIIEGTTSNDEDFEDFLEEIREAHRKGD